MQGIRLSTVTLGAPDPVSLARFYARLLGWQLGPTDDLSWVDNDFASGTTTVAPAPWSTRAKRRPSPADAPV